MPHDDYHIRPAGTVATVDPEGEKVHRPRIGGQIMQKLDAILDAVTNDEENESNRNDGRPEVTFEPELSQLPTTTGMEGEGEGEDEGDEAGNPAGASDAGTGEGSSNVEDGRNRASFRFPHRQRQSSI